MRSLCIFNKCLTYNYYQNYRACRIIPIIRVKSGYFKRIDKYVRSKSNRKIHLRHYVISAGLKEIIEKTSIKKHFHKIFASEYFYDHDNRAVFPLNIVNDTLKTQFLFRINKGRENLNES